jgi:hypothetical protein
MIFCAFLGGKLHMRNAAISLVVMLVLGLSATGQAAPSPTWKIVQVVHLAQQAADTPITTIFTPTTDELYRLTVNIECSAQRGNGGTWNYSISWTLEAAPVRGFCGASNGSGQVITFRGRVGTPVAYSVTGELAPTFTYDLDIVIEQSK